MTVTRPSSPALRGGIALALALAATAAAADTHYTSRVIQQPGDAFSFEALSHGGVALGDIQVPHGQRTFLASYVQSSGRHAARFRPFGAQASRATAMSGSGDVLGTVLDAAGQPSYGYLRRTHGAVAAVAVDGARVTQANGVNATGVVVGSTTSAAGVMTGFSWKDGAFTLYPSTLGGTQSEVRGINDDGTMVGDSEFAAFQTFATQWTPDGQVTNLGTLQGAVGSYARAISPTGLVIGGCQFADFTVHACQWPAGGAAVDLGVPANTQDVNGFAYDINASGVVVGTTNPGLGQAHAVVWQDGHATDLQTVTTLPAGITLGFAESIADDGTILAFGESASGQWYGLLLTPQ